MLSLMLMFVADPGLQQVHVEGRDQATHIDLRFNGRPTFQAFQSEAEGLLVVDVVGGKRPTGFPETIPLFPGSELKLVEHIGSRTRLLRLELHSQKGVPSSARALRGGIRLELRQGSKGLRVFQASGSRLAAARAPESPKPVVTAERGPTTKQLADALGREREETARLRQLLANFRRHSGERADELRGLDVKVSEGRARSKKRQKVLKAAGQALSQLEKKIRLRRQEIVKLEAAEAEAKQRLAQVQGSSRDRTAELNRLELVELAHRAEITRLVREEMDLEKGDTSYLARVAKLQLSINGLAKKQKKLAAKAAKKQAALKAREQESKGLLTEQTRYRRRIADLDRRYASVKKAVKGQDQKLVKLRAKLDGLDGELGTALTRYEQATKRLKKSKASEADLENRAVDLRAQIAKLVRDTADREAQHGQSERRLGREQARVKKLSASVEAARKQAQRAGVLLAKAHKKADETDRRANGLAKELARLRVLASRAERGLSDAQEALGDERGEVEALVKRLAKRRKILADATAKEKSIRAELAETAKAQRRTGQALAAAKKRLEQRQAAVARLQKTLKNKKDKVRRMESSAVSVRQQSLEMSNAEERMRAALGQSRKRFQSSRDEVKARQSEVDALIRERKKVEKAAAKASAKAKNLAVKAKAERARILRARKKPSQARVAPNGFGGERGAGGSAKKRRAEARSKLRDGSKSNVKRVGYRPVGPERVVIHVDGQLSGTLKRISPTTTVFEIPGARSAKTSASLNTKRFGGSIHRISSRLKQGKMRVRITHEAGLRLKTVNKKGRLEVRVR
ncbi:MAG: hypothetical protein CMH55_03585 [Myxococcales bacterium]|nr:hypothetical protein [Myxococcales bacterium]